MNTKRTTCRSNLDEESLQAMEELGLVLKRIYLSLKKSGFRIVDGKLIKPETNEESKTIKR